MKTYEEGQTYYIAIASTGYWCRSESLADVLPDLKKLTSTITKGAKIEVQAIFGDHETVPYFDGFSVCYSLPCTVIRLGRFDHLMKPIEKPESCDFHREVK